MALTALTACGSDDAGTSSADPDQVDRLEAPDTGECRQLTVADLSAPTNATRTIDCREEHTAQTFAAGDLPAALDDAEPDSPEVAAHAYRTCSAGLREFLTADESAAMRSVLTWAWFRPSDDAWEQGARWYRCDVVAGGTAAGVLYPLPRSAAGLLEGRPEDQWLVCARGATIASNPPVRCSEPHDWRAVTTIKLGEPGDPYPGDRLSEVRTRDFCSDSVGAWLGYPDNYDYAYTWFHEAEWEFGNRRSICWAKTDK
ncbi:septum formation family protein [Nocardioides sp.]|uniref:septum formation family protein n=1 Tax=Nocardioides sp. TaxID=35761 RepID=UPI003514DCBD